jgi:hypothetical protein
MASSPLKKEGRPWGPSLVFAVEGVKIVNGRKARN